jgi:putative peptidoglycan lipid II flippase
LVLAAYTLRTGIAPLPGLRFGDLQLGTFARHAGPLTVSGAILQLNVIADRAIASLIAPGAVSALRYAEILVRTPVTAIAPAWSAALYPAQVRAAGGDGDSRLGPTTGRSIAYALVAFIPLGALAAALAPLAVDAAYLRGAFDAGDVAITSNVVAAFAPLILVMMVAPVLIGAHNARRRGFLLLLTGAMNVVMNFILDVTLGAWLGVAGIALSSSVTAIVLVLFLAFRLTKAEADFPLRPLLRTALHAIGAVSIPAALVALVAWSGVGRGSATVDLLLIIALGIFAVAGYALIATRTGLEEVKNVLGLIAQRLRPLARLWPTAR